MINAAETTKASVSYGFSLTFVLEKKKRRGLAGRDSTNIMFIYVIHGPFSIGKQRKVAIGCNWQLDTAGRLFSITDGSKTSSHIGKCLSSQILTCNTPTRRWVC